MESTERRDPRARIGRFRHRFRVAASADEVAGFHRRSSSLPAITPPPIVARIHEAPTELAQGDEMAFSLWLGPLPVRWRARIERLDPSGFTDVQVVGPFRTWEHRHDFVPVSATSTEVVDTVSFRIRRHPVWGPIGLSMVAGLPLLFAYRGWRTRRLLEDRR